MRSEVKIAAVQTFFTNSREENIQKAAALVYQAAEQGAQVILLPELFEGPYFCQQERDEFFDWARPYAENTTITFFQKIARQLKVVLPLSFFEKFGPHYFNSLTVIDADGSLLGLYRKSHIPDGPGYEEKFYFRPGDTGFRVWKTCYANLGIGICWDQWFPECARCLMLLGAEFLLYPTAIGSEPHLPHFNTQPLWQKAMLGHSVCNVVPIIVSNRVGHEQGQSFYGHSFICNHQGEILKQLDHESTGVIVESFQTDDIERTRAAFGFFRDRRPELYQPLVETESLRL